MITDSRGLAPASLSWLFVVALFATLAGQVFGQAPAITSPPLSKIAIVGQAVSFTVGASGATPLTYQWKHNGQVIGGATSATLTIASTVRDDHGWYQVIVSN